MITFQLPKLKLPQNFEKIHSTLKKQGILGNYAPRFNFPDEPQFYQFLCERKVNQPYTKDGFGYGCSEVKEEPVVTAIAEAIEHYCVLFEQEKLFIKENFRNLGKSAIDPLRFKVFSNSQLKQKSFSKFKFDDDTVFNWIEGYSLTRKQKKLVPAQLVYANYQTQKRNEPTIRIPISTGAACGPNLEFALYRGLCETIERDAYMICYLNKLKANVIDVRKHEYLSRFKRRITHYNLIPYFIETTLDFPLTSITCIIIDQSGIGPAVCTGLGTSLSPQKAITSAALEAVRRHIAARDRFFRTKPPQLPASSTIDGFLLRKQRLWAAPHMINTIKPFIMGPKKQVVHLKNQESANDQKNVDLIIKNLLDKGYDAIAVDVTVPQVRNLGLNVIKVLVPELLPLYHDERFPYKENWRLYNTPKLLGFKSDILEEEDIDPQHPF